jgi:hypothetical protein
LPEQYRWIGGCTQLTIEEASGDGLSGGFLVLATLLTGN